MGKQNETLVSVRVQRPLQYVHCVRYRPSPILEDELVAKGEEDWFLVAVSAVGVQRDLGTFK